MYTFDSFDDTENCEKKCKTSTFLDFLGNYDKPINQLADQSTKQPTDGLEGSEESKF